MPLNPTLSAPVHLQYKFIAENAFENGLYSNIRTRILLCTCSNIHLEYKLTEEKTCEKWFANGDVARSAKKVLRAYKVGLKGIYVTRGGHVAAKARVFVGVRIYHQALGSWALQPPVVLKLFLCCNTLKTYLIYMGACAPDTL